MNKKLLAVAKINLLNGKMALFITAIVMGVMLIQDMVFMVLSLFGIHAGKDQTQVAMGNYLYLTVILGAVFLPTIHFRKMMNLGGKRDDFFRGCALTHIITAAAVSLAGVVLYYTYENFIITYYSGETLNVLYWFGWIDNGPVVAFIRQFAFLVLLAAVAHTLSAAQDKWYGWVADALIIAVVSVFTPVAFLRQALIAFFYLVIFHPNAILQITACLAIAAAVYMLNKPILSGKAI